MVSVTAEYLSLGGTQATVGRAGQHTLIADRPEGKAGGMGLGFNGAQLMALALGGCFSNDVHYTADEMGLKVSRLELKVTVDLDGAPLVAHSADLQVTCELEDGGDPGELLERARARCTVAHSFRAGMTVTLG